MFVLHGGCRGPNLPPAVGLLEAAQVRSANSGVTRVMRMMKSGMAVMHWMTIDCERIYYLIIWHCPAPMTSHYARLLDDVQMYRGRRLCGW